MGLSEESNKTYVLNETKDDDAYLLKKIEEATRKINKTTNALVISALLAMPLIYLSLFLLGPFGIFLIVIFYISIIAFGTVAIRSYDKQRVSYFRNLKVIPNYTNYCPNCKRNLPKYYAYKCIFCGYYPITICQKCKKTQPLEHGKFCIYCGKPIKYAYVNPPLVYS
jgi:hypothetical protein